jgi:hypothetical protein
MPRKSSNQPLVAVKPFASQIEACHELGAAVVVLEALAEALEVAKSVQSLQRTLGHFSDWLWEVCPRHAPIDATLHERVLAVLARLAALSSEPLLPTDVARLHEDLEALRAK